MRILQIGNSHPRNQEFIQRICAKLGHEYHRSYTLQYSDIEFDIVWSPGQWFHPDRFPNSKILYGPQFWVFPDANHPIFHETDKSQSSRCIYTCLSQWNYAVYNEFVDLSASNIPFKCLPFGLHIQECPVKDSIEFDCIIYFKARHPYCLQFVVDFVNSKKLSYKVFSYGSYKLDDYLAAVKKCKFVIWVGSHESQGFAVAECLLSNTPIFVFDVLSMKDEFAEGKFTYTSYTQKLLATTASYWDSRCGVKVTSEDEFCSQFDDFFTNLKQFKPWEFVSETLSDEVCFKRICDAFGINA
jgi:hypothetical protein